MTPYRATAKACRDEPLLARDSLRSCLQRYVGLRINLQGGSAVTKDLPPFTVSVRLNKICGLNTVGLRRAGYTEAQRLELRQVYHALFRSGDNLRAAVTDARKRFSSAAAKTMIEFVAGAKRGVCADVGRARRIEDDEV